MRLLLSEFKESKNFRFLVIVSALAFIPTIGLVHLFDWDEINFAESAREMLVSGDYFQVQINYSPFWEKPPLFFWLQSGSMHLFGVNEFGARFPNALAGIITIIVIYFLGKKEKSARFGTIWALLYLASFLPQIYFRSAIIDPVFNLFIFLSTYYLFKALTQVEFKNKRALLAGIFCGLAILTKGPVGFLLVFVTFLVFIIIKKFKILPTFKQFLIFALSVFGVSFLWFGAEVINNGPWFLVEFINYQIELFSQGVAGHEQPFYYHFIVVFMGVFPLSALALPSLIKRKRDSELEQWWTILFWVVMIIFSIATTKIVHYSSMTYLPLSFLAAVTIHELKWAELKKWTKGIYFFLAGFLSIAFLALPLVGMFNSSISPYINDPFAVAGFDNPDVTYTGLEPLIAVIFVASIVLFIRFWKREDIIKALQWKAVLFSLTMSLTMIFVVKKIEGYSQAPMIEFYEDLKGQEVYVSPIGFKSYAQFFYFQQPESPNAHLKMRKEKFNNEAVLYTPLETEVKLFLLYEKIEYDAYFVTKIQHTELDEIDYIEFLYQKGGYKFYKRKANIELLN
ncbi:MAG: 4-amino-4-deoxy-L-arabinose transferase-like glycosyltransferase [Arenicella sp.]|jgi:4-amino-4-deoxy-L-arabinose transferase-like glycosyltransferase